MKREKSCGAVIYKIENEEIYYLLEHSNLGHWSFAKGHVEKNETEEETALREIKEETNLNVTLDTNFRYINTYSPKENVVKDVIYFVAKYDYGNIIPQIKEIKEILWLKKEEVLNYITYNEDRKMYLKASEYIQNNKKN